MLKLSFFLVSSLISFIVWQMRQAKGKARLAEIDEGRRCIACDRTNLERAAGMARCLSCGHTVSLASLQSVVVSASEIASVTRPDDRRR